MKNSLKISFNAPVTLTFVILCFVATILNYITLGAANNVLFTTFRAPLSDPLTYIRFFTHVIGHANILMTSFTNINGKYL